ncbi:MAG: peptide deformylase [Patescibacteria group bacterium]
MTNQILQAEAPVLRATAAPVAAADFGTPALIDELRRMSAALGACDDGVALAAPQIGLSKRIFVVSGKVFGKEGEPPPPDQVFINPEIVKFSRKKVVLEEGCLSVRPLYGLVKRAEKVSVMAYDQNGKKFERRAAGLLAQIFQHEIDHLNGVLFIDLATDVRAVKNDT